MRKTHFYVAIKGQRYENQTNLGEEASADVMADDSVDLNSEHFTF